MFGKSATLFSVLAALSANAALADNYYLALPEQRTGDAAPILRAAQLVFEGLGRNDGFSLINSTDGSVRGTFSIPDKGRYNLRKYVGEDFAAEKRQVQTSLWAMAQSAPVAPEALMTNVPAVLSAIGDLRSSQSGPAQVLLVGSPLHKDAKDGTISMLYEAGEIQVPSDGFLAGSLLLSPYGLGVNRDTLKGVTVHFCALQPKLSAYDQAAVSRFWAHYIAMRGGKLVTYSADLAVCLNRFQKGQHAALEVTALDRDALPAMVRAARASQVANLVVDERTALSEQLKRDKQTNQDRVRVLEERLVVQADRADREATRAEVAERNLAVSENAREKAEAELTAVKNAMQAGNKLDGVTTFSRFQDIPHPRKSGLTVSTGVRYALSDFPAYANSWCYMNVKNSAGSMVRLYLGDKNPGDAIDWNSPGASILRDVGLSGHDVRAAHQSCRFPKQ